MLKKKVLSLVLALSMLSGLGIVTAQAESTDSVKEVITDSTSYTNYAHQFNRLHTNTNNLTSYKNDAALGRGIGGEDNVCAKFTAEGATITNESRFDTNKVTYNGSTSGQESIGPAKYPEDIMYWSLDVWGNTEIDNIQFKSRGGMQISPVISKSQLKANQWNTLMVIMYPNETNSASSVLDNIEKIDFNEFYKREVVVDAKAIILSAEYMRVRITGKASKEKAAEMKELSNWFINEKSELAKINIMKGINQIIPNMFKARMAELDDFIVD